tara:strand:- start:13803 stop:14153 length:351 start_codon:yes stop_codon:yes gene_type:complete
MYNMGCRMSKVKKVHNAGFDLLDSDGDNRVSQEEIEIVAQYLHTFQVNRSVEAHNALVNTSSVDYLYDVVDKKKNSKLLRSDFNKIAYIIPYAKWQRELLPILRRKEIQRLTELTK